MCVLFSVGYNHSFHQCQGHSLINCKPGLFDHPINFLQNKTQNKKFQMSVVLKDFIIPEKRGVCVNMST